MALSARQRRHAAEYIIDLRADLSAIRAGYSESWARKLAAISLAKPEVAAEVARLMAAREERTQVTQDRVVAEYAKLAFLDPRKFFDDDGGLIPIHELPADVAAALAGVDVVESRVGTDEDGKPIFAPVRKIKFADKRGSLDSLARHLGMFTDRVEHSGSLDHYVRALTPEQVAEELKRLEHVSSS